MTDNVAGDAQHILVIDYAEKDAKLLQQFLEQEGYEVVTATSLAKVDALLEEPEEFTLALVDADGFPTDLWDRCARLQDLSIPFLVLSLSPEDVEEVAQGRSSRPVAEKPIKKDKLLEFIASITE